MSPGPPHSAPAHGLPADTGRVIELITRPATAAVLVLGEMGMGKSALLDGAAQALGERLEVLRLHGSPALAKVPYGVLAPFLGGLPPAGAASRVEVLRAFWRAVEALRQGAKPDLLLVIDDAHELDAASSEVVAELVSARWTKAAMAAPSGAALPRPLMELWLDDGVERVDLAPLTVEQVRSYLEAALGGPVLPTVPQLLWQESEGNPLLLGRLVEEARRSGALGLHGQTWLVTEDLPHRGEGLLALARAQLGRLGPGEREALSLIVVAEPAPFALVERECGAEAIRRLVAMRLVRPAEGPDGVLRLRHQVYGDALLALIPLTTALALRERVAGHLARQASTGQGLLRAVTWALHCGFPVEDEALLAAARLALGLHENTLAARAASAVQRPGARDAARDVLGQVAYSRGRYAEAAALLRPAASGRGSIRPGLAGGLAWIAARRALGHAAEALRAEIERLPGAGAGGLRDVLALVVASDAGDRDWLADGLRRWRSGHRQGRGSPHGAAAEAVVCALEAELLMASGRPLGAARPLRAALGRAAGTADATPCLQAFGATRLVLADLAAGEWEAAEDDLQRFLIASRAGLVTDGPAAQMARGVALVRRGRFRAAWEALAPALDALHGRDPQRLLPLAAAVAAYAGARAGEHGAARTLLGSAEDRAVPAVALVRPVAGLFTAAARHVLDAAAGSAGPDSPGAGERLEAAVDGAAGEGRLDVELQGELLCFEAGRRDRLARLLEVAHSTEGRWAEAAAVLADAFAARSPGGLLEAGERLSAGGLDLLRARLLRRGIARLRPRPPALRRPRRVVEEGRMRRAPGRRGTPARRRIGPADAPRARGGRLRRGRAQRPRDRRTAHRLGPHHRGTPLPGLCQARGHEPRTARRSVRIRRRDTGRARGIRVHTGGEQVVPVPRGSRRQVVTTRAQARCLVRKWGCGRKPRVPGHCPQGLGRRRRNLPETKVPPPSRRRPRLGISCVGPDARRAWDNGFRHVRMP
ncbi:tetratricopeptide (TPR) repeat protein [Sinomonas atrocyanea]|nr:AAA family ATPase [Sinomonas atrocyanea]MDP9883331.1 tetratricopeptide (TPR) repeat protein [Sinomonas atrocyanea]